MSGWYYASLFKYTIQLAIQLYNIVNIFCASLKQTNAVTIAIHFYII